MKKLLNKLVLFATALFYINHSFAGCNTDSNLRLIKFLPSHLAVCLPTEAVIKKTIYDFQNDTEVRYNVFYKGKSFVINIESRNSTGLSDMLYPVYETKKLLKIDDKTELIKWKCGENSCAYAFFGSPSPVSNNYNTTLTYSLSGEDQYIGDEFIEALFIDSSIKNVQKPDFVNDIPVKINIGFKAGSSVIEPEYYAQIADFAKFVNENNAKIIIEGHTDKYEIPGGYTIDDQRSFDLSKVRAEMLQSLLVSQYSVDPNNTKKVIGNGHLRPIAPSNTEPNRQKNRRVQAYIE